MNNYQLSEHDRKVIKYVILNLNRARADAGAFHEDEKIEGAVNDLRYLITVDDKRREQNKRIALGIRFYGDRRPFRLSGTPGRHLDLPPASYWLEEKQPWWKKLVRFSKKR